MGTYTQLLKSESPPAKQKASKRQLSSESAPPANERKVKKGSHDTTIPPYHDTLTPRYHDTTVEKVRKRVKEFGKEAATHRFTDKEKGVVAEIIFTYKSQGIRTSENEITRIAINYAIEDYKENGENSILDKVLKALNE